VQRIPEPELMDTEEQAAAYAAADFAEPHDMFVDRFGRRFPGFPRRAPTAARVIDLGCGPADVTARFALAYPDVAVLGVDAGPNMLRHARMRLERDGLGGRVTVEERHIPDPGLASLPPFAAVLSNSLLHHLDDPGVLWSTVTATGGPDTAVFVMDLARPVSTDAARKLTDHYAADEPAVLRDDFFHSLCAAYTPEEILAQIEAAGLHDRLTVALVSDRHLTVSGTL
jgi:SAM-dependent methyltransferase